MTTDAPLRAQEETMLLTDYHYIRYRWSAETDQPALLDFISCAKDHTVR